MNYKAALLKQSNVKTKDSQSSLSHNQNRIINNSNSNSTTKDTNPETNSLIKTHSEMINQLRNDVVTSPGLR